MTMLSEIVDAVIGVDTHRDTHALAMLSPYGATIAETVIDSDDDGLTSVLTWISEHAPGPRVVVGVEGTRSYGTGLVRVLQAAGVTVVEVARPQRVNRRGIGKSDPIDARLGASIVLAMDADALPVPRADGPREALRILLAARNEISGTRTRHANMLHALLLTGTSVDRELNRGAFTAATLTTLTRRRGVRNETIDARVRREECSRLAQAIRAADLDLAENNRQLKTIVTQLNPTVLDVCGIGPVTAAQTLVSWSHHGRIRNEAAFAALAGVCPLPASSGRTIRYRLNRGGDRDLNKAIHQIVLTRWRCDERTRDYVNRRKAEGKSNAEIRRCLKRYVARELHKHLTANNTS